MKAKKSNPKRASKVDALPSSTTKKIPAELKAVVEKAATIFNDLTENELGGRYALGVLVRDAMDHAKYGDAALAAFADKLHLDESTLRIHASVTRVWDEKKFNALAKRRGGTKPSYRLSWSHFVLLAADMDGRTRRGLINAAFADALSEKALRALRADRESATRHNEATAAKEPKGSVLDATRTMVSACEALCGLLNKDGRGAATVEELRSADEALAQLEQLVSNARAELSRAVARVAPPAASVSAAVEQVVSAGNTAQEIEQVALSVA
jgi:hypothetical protein